MGYSLYYHTEVREADIRYIPSNIQLRISEAIRRRLETSPELYGIPLRGTLKGYHKLRVGDYRVVYKIHGKEIGIFAILHRRKVYQEVLKRL